MENGKVRETAITVVDSIQLSEYFRDRAMYKYSHVIALAAFALVGCLGRSALAADGEPFQRRVNVIVQNGETFARSEFVASDSRRLVIEHVSFAAHVQPGSGQNAMVVISTTAGGETLGHTAAAGVNIGGTIAAGQSTPAVERLIASHPMRVYADPRTKISVSVERHGPKTGSVSTYVMISGRLENP